MIWLKRLLPFVLLILIGGGWFLWDKNRQAERLERTQRYAQITARVWVGAAQYRDSAEVFLAWRDSLLRAEGLSADTMEAYLKQGPDDVHQQEDFARLVSYYVDSISNLLENPPDSLVDTTSVVE